MPEIGGIKSSKIMPRVNLTPEISPRGGGKIGFGTELGSSRSEVRGNEVILPRSVRETPDKPLPRGREREPVDGSTVRREFHETTVGLANARRDLSGLIDGHAAGRERDLHELRKKIMLNNESPDERQERQVAEQQIDRYTKQLAQTGTALDIPEGCEVLFYIPNVGGQPGDVVTRHIFVPKNYTLEDVRRAHEEAGIPGEFTFTKSWLRAYNQAKRIFEGIGDVVDEVKEELGRATEEKDFGTERLTVVDAQGNLIMVKVRTGADKSEVEEALLAEGIKPENAQVIENNGRRVKV